MRQNLDNLARGLGDAGKTGRFQEKMGWEVESEAAMQGLWKHEMQRRRLCELPSAMHSSEVVRRWRDRQTTLGHPTHVTRSRDVAHRDAYPKLVLSMPVRDLEFQMYALGR